MKEVTTIGLDLAKTVFQVHGVDAAGAVVVRRAVRRRQVVEFFAKLPRCLVGIEACATAHYWGRELTRLGHEVRLIAPAYAKAYVRRNKNDAADAAAICEAVGRPSMRFVAIKSEAQQAAAGIHKSLPLARTGVREMLVKQRTMLINTLRGLMAEFGIIAADGPRHVGDLVAVLTDPSDERIPSPLREGLLAIVESLRGLEQRIERVEKQIVCWGSRQCGLPAPDHHPRLRADPVERDGGAGDRPRRLQPSRRLCRLAWAGAAAGRHRRQAAARPDQQARQRLSAPALGQRRDVADQSPARQARSLDRQAARQ
jgi:Transposase